MVNKDPLQYKILMANPKNTPFDSVDDVLKDISCGKMVIVTDDESRENEGDLVMAASQELLPKQSIT